MLCSVIHLQEDTDEDRGYLDAILSCAQKIVVDMSQLQPIATSTGGGVCLNQRRVSIAEYP